jgi:long-chain fatty acid transport protein
MQKKLMLGIFVLLMSTSLVLASGFSIYEHGAKSMALAGAFTAQANDASAVFYNPAGITQLSGWNFMAGGTYIMPTSSFTGPTPLTTVSELEEWNFLVPHFYATYAITEDLSAGFGFFVPFGLGTNWGNDWVGKQLATKSEVQTMFFNPVIAYQVTEGLSLAAGVEYVLGNIALNRVAVLPPQLGSLEGDVELSGDAKGAFGFNFGALYQATDNLSLGLAWRSNVDLDIDGTATFAFPVTGNPQLDGTIAALFPETDGTATISLPTFLNLGIAYKPLENLTVELDWFQIGWSSYDKLAVDFEPETQGVTDIEVTKDWKDVSSIRLGTEYRWNEKLALRLGVLRDFDPMPDETVDPSLPGGDRWLFCLGGGYSFGSLTVDLGYNLLMQDDRTIETSDSGFNGTYESSGHLLTMTLGYAIK